MKNSDSNITIVSDLFGLKDAAYRDFQAKLIPTVDPERIIGVRTPDLRKYAAQCDTVWSSEIKESFLQDLPHYYYEENNLHAFLLARAKVPKNVPFNTVMNAVEQFLPYIDNWATCDMFALKFFAAYPEEIFRFARKWISDGRTYTVRFGVVTLLQFFLDGNFTLAVLDLAASCAAGDYYVDMAVAWFFSVALVKQYKDTLPYITQRRLSPWVHNKAIQKAIESHRISDDTKNYLRTLKI